MRSLTILRKKKYVASLAKMKVYIEDPNSSELVINKVRCRLLGTLKNGEEKTFEITEDAARIYVIGDKLSKNFCNDFYELPAGSDPVLLTGENKYNPLNGNAFRFDGVTSKASESNRKKGLIIGAVVLAVAFIVGFIVGFIGESGLGTPKDFKSEDLTITLTDEFTEGEAAGYIGCYESDNVLVMISTEPKSMISDDLDVAGYAALFAQVAGSSKSPKTQDGLTYVEYDSNVSAGEKYHYVAFVFLNDNDFYIVQFATFHEDASEYFEDIMSWAKTVKFN